MKPERLLKLFDRVADAPDAVARLRRLVLDLAVRGKLVAQYSEDEPAQVLLEQMRASKFELLAKLKVRIPASLAAIQDEPFALPGNWKWVRLGDIGFIMGGGTPHSDNPDNFSDKANGIPWLTPADLGKFRGKYISHGARFLSIKGLESSSAQLLPTGSVLFTSRAPIGYVAIAQNPLTTNQGFKSVVPFLTATNHYIFVYFKAFAEEINKSAPGTTFKEVSGKAVSQLLCPLPPLPEQHRIVQRVDELMSLCDQLEAAQADREQRRNRLSAAALDRLVNAEPGEEGRIAAHFYLNRLPRLVRKVEHVQALRQMISQLAVQGKLVKQASTEEPARLLIDKIKHEKEKFALVGAIKKSKPLPPIHLEDKPYALPEGWTWARTEDISLVIVDCPHSTPKFVAQGVACIDTNCFKSGKLLYNKLRFVTEDSFIERTDRLVPKTGDIIFAREGSVGESVIVPPNLRCCLGQRVMLFRPAPMIFNQYFQLTLSEPSFLHRLMDLHKGIGAKHVNVGDMRNALIPVPPAEEQYRIVAKVNQISSLCDQLEVTLKTSQQTTSRLLDALIAEALSDSPDSETVEAETQLALSD